MPQNVNLAQPLAELNPQVNSVRAWLYRAWNDKGVEVPIAQCCYVEFQSFTGNNQTGTQLLPPTPGDRGLLDTGTVPIFTFYGVATFSQLLQKVFS